MGKRRAEGQGESGYKIPESRVDTRFVGGHFEKELAIKFKAYASKNDTTIQELVRKAIVTMLQEDEKGKKAGGSAKG